MRSKAKTVAPGIVIAITCLAPVSAPATNGGHFVVDVPHAQLAIHLNLPSHQMHFVTEGSPGTKCTVASHLGTTTATTSTQLDIVPSYKECYTDSGSSELKKFETTLNGCLYRFTVAPLTANETEQTIDFVCPAGSAAVFHDPSCTITMRPQTSVNAATYKTLLEDGKHILTLSMHAKFVTDFHSGPCIFFGTKHVTELQGAATLKATNTAGELINITAT